jgi:hypothetical protein
VFIYVIFPTNEHLETNEAIQNLANMYNSGNVKTNKLTLGTKWTLQGGENDDWLKLTDVNGTSLYGGVMTKKLQVDDVEIKGNFKTPTIQSVYNKIIIGKTDNTNDIFVPRKYYTINANFPNGDFHNWPKSKIDLANAIKYANTRHDINKLGENSSTIWFKQCAWGDSVVAGKEWPDEFIGCGGAGDASPIISTLQGMRDIQTCKNKCKDNQECTFAQYNIWEDKCYLRKDGTDGIKTHFLNKHL